MTANRKLKKTLNSN